ncbi:hypothetical protein OOK60_10945 [Trichothermofontia sichuanensis B231]|uniref:hypothetical protein n=1 Tax=Trichothermofontia sichuanensis TaxID=3045816 RepID=UPI00224650B4|nr:hypothetical protein [Trichothermofontia sichuanensis]UZQ53037.1 hypothetical protein OOK60_10945 [Trichothermofontia sichuanensis B231]
MVNSSEGIAQQARRGSVAAIIQVLNERLAVFGVRTRAIFADGVLQLLCEAASADQLAQTTLVNQIREILEAIAPRNIRRVNINSRLAREQQLLWLEEISRDPENQLLWSEEITLRKPNPIALWLEDLKAKKAPNPPLVTSTQPVLPHYHRNHHPCRRGLLGGIGITILLGLGGWAIWQWGLQPRFFPRSSAPAPTPTVAPTPTAKITAAAPTVSAIAANADPFAEAVRLAEQATAAGKTAQLPAQWLELAARWQQASDLMATVPSQDPRYAVAQDRTQRYRQNSELALQEAQRRRQATP